MTRQFGPPFPGWSATCQYILSENHFESPVLLGCLQLQETWADPASAFRNPHLGIVRWFYSTYYSYFEYLTIN